MSHKINKENNVSNNELNLMNTKNNIEKYKPEQKDKSLNTIDKEEDPNYPPPKTEHVKLKKLERKRSLVLLNNNKRGKHSKKANNKVNDKNIDNNIEWGLGVEHEFMLMVDNINNATQAINLIEKISGSKLTTEKKKEINSIYRRSKPFVVIPYPNNVFIKNTDIEIEIEKTSLHHLVMYEIKNMKFHNVTLTDVSKEIDRKLDGVKTMLSKFISKDIGHNINLITPPYGAHNILYLDCYVKKEVNCSLDKFKLYTDYTGSYHFWITLPHIKNDLTKNINLMHQKAISLLQTIEPLLCSLYGSSDPNIYKEDNITKLKGSYRAGNNLYASYGTSPSSTYGDISDWFNENSIFSRQINRRIYQSRKLDFNLYSNNVVNKINNRIDRNEIPKYIINQKRGNFTMGADFRRRNNIKGFEFRIWDHFPQEYVKDILKIIYLISCYATMIPAKHLIYSISDQDWNYAMRDALLEGYLMKINNKYVSFINKQFKLKTTNQKNNQKQMQHLIDYVWDKVMGDKVTKNMYLLMVGDEVTKPKVININKMSQDFACNKSKVKSQLKKHLNKGSKKK